MFLEELVAENSNLRTDIDTLLAEAATIVCGEVIEDRAVSEERLEQYRSLQTLSALDQYVVDELPNRGLLSSKKEGLSTYWGPLEGLLNKPTFETYSRLLVEQGFGFTDAVAEQTQEARVVSALKHAVEKLKAAMHPNKLTLGTDIHRYFRYQGRAQSIEPISSDAEVELIVGGQYPYRVGELIDEAKVSISMAMFIVSWGDAGHPARRLVEKLIAAHQRGVKVEILLDQDRRDDLYMTRQINRPAANALKEAGVNVRFDKTTELTHSKVVVVDQQFTVIGSHNWSRSSFFQYDEISVLITDVSVGVDYHEDLSRRIKKGLSIPEPDIWIEDS
ncbi:MAG: phospholipase D-like domain-containing protein [Gammaproteobacteria bacterium]